MLNDPFQFLNKHVSVSHETFGRLTVYYELLKKWQAKINLVSQSSLQDAWQRHFLDSAQLISQLRANSTIVDIGSGAGFPGMVLAIMGAGEIHLVESDAKKIAFLEEVKRETKTVVDIHHGRIEQIPLKKPDVILARGLAELDKLFSYIEPSVSHETICLFHKGKNYSKEIEDAEKNWHFNCNIIDSVTDREGVILQIANIRRMRK